MGDDGRVSPSFVTLNQYATYNHTLSSSVSTINTSLWSDTASQSSDDTSIANDSDACESYCAQKRAATTCDNVATYRHALQQRPVDAPVPVELRQNPRRTGPGNRARAVCPPALVRQCDRKVNFVDSLVDSSTQIVETIWPLSSVVCRSELGSKAVLPLRTFIQETLRRSRTSYSTLQVALYYLILIKPHVPKHDFTTEQPDERHADRALQCGRRMFLAALILASKYLQDRNYSARAWSKISGLNTQEINQNEISFLLAVNWKLHIAEDVFQRWTEIVLKYTPPPSPPSPGGVPQTITQQSLDWKNLILKLNPELNNIEGLIPTAIGATAKRSDLSVLSPRSILNPPVDLRSGFESADAKTISLKSLVSPVNMEPMAAGRMAPTMGMLPTPRLTPQTNGLCTPAVSAASQMLCKTGAMGFAMAQANCFNNAQLLERIPTSVSSSPQSYFPARRSSLANSVSAASSPESMISDTSRTSRSSSISSISSLASATTYNKLSGPSRFRAAKIWNERFSMKPTVPSVPEDHDELIFSASPESYNGSVSKLGDLSLDTPLARRELELDGMTRDPISDAARALQDLHNQDLHSAGSTPTTGRKRTRSTLTEGPLQDNVREILNLGYEYSQPAWSHGLADSRKRLRCSTEVANGLQPSAIHPAISHQGNGIWEGILN